MNLRKVDNEQKFITFGKKFLQSEEKFCDDGAYSYAVWVNPIAEKFYTSGVIWGQNSQSIY